MTVLSVLHVAAGVLLAVAGLLVLYRIVRGPGILDRMIASDVLLTTVILALCADMAIGRHTRTLTVVLVLTGTAVFGSVAVARYVSRQRSSEQAPQDGDGQAAAAIGDAVGEAKRPGAATLGGDSAR